MRKISVLLLCAAALTLPAKALALGFSRDTVQSWNWGSDSTWLRNPSSSRLTLDHISIKILSGRLGHDLLFNAGTGAREASFYFLFDSAGADSLVSRIELRSGTTLAVAARDSLLFKGLLYGDCIGCVSAGRPPADALLRVTFYFSGKQSASFILNGNYISGSVARRRSPAAVSGRADGGFDAAGRIARKGGMLFRGFSRR